MKPDMDFKWLIKAGSIAGACASLIGTAYAGFSFMDDRYAKSETVISFQTETCKQIAGLSLQMIQSKIFELEVKKGEAERAPKQKTNTPGAQWFSAVDEALLQRAKQQEIMIQNQIKSCETQKR